MRLKRDFYIQDASIVASSLIGKYLVRKFDDGTVCKMAIEETEAYGGKEDLASHARFGRTKRNDAMYQAGGVIYVYLIYGIYWMLNIVTSTKDNPQAVLIRKLHGINGPGKVGKFLKLDKKFYAEDVVLSDRIWVEENRPCKKYMVNRLPRIGVDYAGIWAKRKWRFSLGNR